MNTAIVILSSHIDNYAVHLFNSHTHLTKKYQKGLKATMVLCEDTKKNLKSVPFTKIQG